jgi:hypothetical protein
MSDKKKEFTTKGTKGTKMSEQMDALDRIGRAIVDATIKVRKALGPGLLSGLRLGYLINFNVRSRNKSSNAIRSDLAAPPPSPCPWCPWW